VYARTTPFLIRRRLATGDALTTVIHNAAIVTVDDRDTVHYDGAIAIEGDRIAAIGSSADLLARYPAAERLDGRGKMVMPGFANVHTHLTVTLARGVFEDLSPPHRPPFSGGLSPIPLPDMTPDERRAMAQLGALEASRSGTTLALEDSNDVDHYAGALADTGLRWLLSERAYDRVGTSIGDPAPYRLDRALGQKHLRIIEDTFHKWNGKLWADGSRGVGPRRARYGAWRGRKTILVTETVVTVGGLPRFCKSPCRRRIVDVSENHADAPLRECRQG
jgi:5-methylthioadenosine/S-adenosylhomocysteine deaminase